MTGAHRLVALLSDIEVLARVGTVPDEDELVAVRVAYDEARRRADRAVLLVRHVRARHVRPRTRAGRRRATMPRTWAR